MPLLHKNSDENNKHTPKGFTNASNGDYLLRDEKGESTYTRNRLLPSAINFVDGNATPPTEVSGNIYVLIDEGNGAVNSAWDGAAYNDWVKFDGSLWYSITPSNGDFTFDETAGVYKLFSSTSWAEFVPEVDTIYTANGTLTENRNVALGGFDLGFTGGSIGFGTSTPDASAIVDLSSTDKGLLLPRMTTAQMNAISAPATNLLIWNTDLDAMYRYDGANWVALTSGYGIIEVMNDGNNGRPVYFADLQSALETCKTGTNTVTLYNNITLTSQINVTTALGFTFDSLTINGNGFKITFDDAGTDDAIDVTVANEVKVLNLIIERLNGTGTHYAFYNNGAAVLNMSNCYFYSNNGGALFLAAVDADLGNSKLESDGSISTLVIGNATNCKSFKAVSNGSGTAVDNNFKASYFICENTSTGRAYDGDSNSVGTFFEAKSNSGNCVETSNECSHFNAYSTSGIGIISTVGAGSDISNFYCITGNNIALRNDLGRIYNGVAINNSSNATFFSVRTEEVDNLFIKNEGSGYALDSFQNTSATVNRWNKITAISEGGVAGTIRSNAGQIKNSTFISRYNNAAGHSMFLQVTGCSLLNCIFEVVNASANGLNATTAINAGVANCTFNGATTPINANVTVNASTDLGNGNRQY